MSQNAIKIADCNHGSSYTSFKRATRYVLRGVATWLIPNKVIRFNRDHPQYVAPTTKRIYTAGIGIATLDQVRGLPVTGNAINLFIVKRRRAA